MSETFADVFILLVLALYAAAAAAAVDAGRRREWLEVAPLPAHAALVIGLFSEKPLRGELAPDDWLFRTALLAALASLALAWRLMSRRSPHPVFDGVYLLAALPVAGATLIPGFGILISGLSPVTLLVPWTLLVFFVPAALGLAVLAWFRRPPGHAAHYAAYGTLALTLAVIAFARVAAGIR